MLKDMIMQHENEEALATKKRSPRQEKPIVAAEDEIPESEVGIEEKPIVESVSKKAA